jgi:NADPH2:quinone reductase
MRAVVVEQFGGPEVIAVGDAPDPVAGDGFELVTVSASGVNYADTHAVEDSYLSKQSLPFIPGSEVVGRTADGRRISALVGTGGYAELALAHPAMSFELPDKVSDAEALALMVQGLTAWHLLRTSTHLGDGESVVVHAAAGGVGTIAVQLAKMWGAGRIIGVASTAEKRSLVQELGADVTVDAAADDLRSAIIEANSGRPVDIVLEMVGGPTFDASLAALAPFGRLATFGMASRTPPAPVDPRELLSKSAAVIGFWLTHCIGRPGMLHEPMAEMLAMVADGRLRPQTGDTYPMSRAREAHEALRSRSTVGKLVLDPTG